MMIHPILSKLMVPHPADIIKTQVRTPFRPTAREPRSKPKVADKRD